MVEFEESNRQTSQLSRAHFAIAVGAASQVLGPSSSAAPGDH